MKEKFEHKTEQMMEMLKKMSFQYDDKMKKSI